ncbi:MAG TPA: DUF4191 domain-containing protein [Egibacteraceae bacterium]|nr:DUF4191 domain-containing protein [Egibacteraceae bacterium]
MASDRFAAFTTRLRQLGQAFSNTRKVDPKLVPLVVGIPLAVLAVCVGLGLLLDRPVGATVLGVLLALMTALAVFGRRASKAMLSSIEGQPGAAAAVLQTMRGKWRVTPAVAFTRKQAFVHRVVGRPGVVLVGEGAPARVRSLLRQEARKVARVVGDTPVHEVSVGDGEGQVPLDKLQAHLAKLRRAVRPRDLPALDNRLKALGDRDVPLPKGPMPRGKRRM